MLNKILIKWGGLDFLFLILYYENLVFFLEYCEFKIKIFVCFFYYICIVKFGSLCFDLIFFFKLFRGKNYMGVFYNMEKNIFMILII